MVKRVAARLTCWFHYPPVRVFNAWIDPNIATRWLISSGLSDIPTKGHRA